MDEAMSNIEAALTMFTQEEKGVMKVFWRKWHFTSQESLSKELSHFQVAKKFIYETGCVTRSMYRKVEMSHPGHLMVATIATYGPFYAVQHVARIQAGETDIPILDYGLFGDLAFLPEMEAEPGGNQGSYN